MRVALVSAEYVGASHDGGIGTYMRNLAAMLAARGHDVEVFAAGTGDAMVCERPGVTVNYVRIAARGDFGHAIAPVVVQRNDTSRFDVIEGADFLAETLPVSDALPSLPLVLKLHTPQALISLMDMDHVPLQMKARFILGSLARGKKPKPYWVYRQEVDIELQNVRRATLIAAPSRAVIRALDDLWGLNHHEVRVIPNVYFPDGRLSEINPCSNSMTVSFIGRQEILKGVLDFAHAIPLILSKVPAARFRVIGRPMRHSVTGFDVGRAVSRILRPYSASVQIIPGISYNDLLEFYAKTDICVVPSHWDNFPNVCLEAMVAARGVVASSAGGLPEIVENGISGLLVPPKSPAAIANAVVQLLNYPEQRTALGSSARERVSEAFSPDAIAPLQENLYREAMAKHAARAGRVQQLQLSR